MADATPLTPPVIASLAHLEPCTPPELIEAAERLQETTRNRVNVADRLLGVAPADDFEAPLVVVRNPSMDASTTPILDQFMRGVELESLIDDGMSTMVNRPERFWDGQNRFWDETMCDDRTNVEREDIGLQVYRCQWGGCDTELPDGGSRCIECEVLLCEFHSYRCHRCDTTPFCARHWEPIFRVTSTVIRAGARHGMGSDLKGKTASQKTPYGRPGSGGTTW